VRRQPQVFHLSRIRIHQLRDRLAKQEVPKWPQHLKLAFEVLTERLKVEHMAARSIVIAASESAYICAVEITRQSLSIERQRICEECGRQFRKLANNVAQVPVKLRRSINQSMAAIIDGGYFDSESLGDILRATADHLRVRLDNPSAGRALKAIQAEKSGGRSRDALLHSVGYEDPPGEGHYMLLNLYSGLDPSTRHKIESTVNIAIESPAGMSSTADLFACIASAIGRNSSAKRKLVANSIIDHVKRTAILWRSHGLKPTRARHYDDPHYKSNFHLFSDLVLTALADPDSLRHDKDLEEVKRRKCDQLTRLPNHFRKHLSAAMRRRDIEWLVSDDHVKKALSSLPNSL